MNRSPFSTLTRHFVSMLVAPPMLSDLGVDFLRRTLASLLAIFIMVGIFLTRAMFKRYVDLHAAWDAEAYWRAVQADTLLMIAVPMLVVGLVTMVMAPLLFPDETDYRVLSPLPLSRLQIFAAKLSAVFLVTSAVILAVNAVTSFWFPLASGPSWSVIGPRWMPYTASARIAAHAAAALSGSIWMFSTVMAVQGLCLAFVPSRWRRSASVAVQSGMVVLALMAIPYIVRLPSLEVNSVTAQQAPLLWFPPVWFLGVEWWLLEPAPSGYANMARLAFITMPTSLTLVAISYAWLFRTAEKLVADPSAARRKLARPGAPFAPVAPVARVAPVFPQPTRAIWEFALQGLSRSRLHQAIFVLIAGTGLALLLGQAWTVLDVVSDPWRPRARVYAALAAPLVATLAMTLALRAALLLPADQGASWMFRVTEFAATRPLALNGVTRLFIVAAVVPAVLVAALLQPAVLGARWVATATLAAISGLVLVEVVLRDWCRLPYTCTYLPGKRVLAYTLGVLLTAYAVFVYLNSRAMYWSLTHAWRTLLYGGVLLAAFGALYRSRMQTWGKQALEFEDEDPLAIRKLNLSPDERN